MEWLTPHGGRIVDWSTCNLYPRGPLRELNPNGARYPARKTAATEEPLLLVHWAIGPHFQAGEPLR